MTDALMPVPPEVAHLSKADQVDAALRAAGLRPKIKHVSPTCRLKRESPEVFMAAVRKAAQLIARNGTWKQAAQESGFSKQVLRKWDSASETKMGKVWLTAIADEKAIADGKPAPSTIKRVDITGFKSPEHFCDHWSMEAARVQVEVMLDEKALRKERVDAAKRVQDLGGHSPINRSVVISAPLDNPAVAQALMDVLAEVRAMREVTPLLSHQEAS